MILLQCEQMRCTPLGEGMRPPFPQREQVLPCDGAVPSAFMLSLLARLGPPKKLTRPVRVHGLLRGLWVRAPYVQISKSRWHSPAYVQKSTLLMFYCLGSFPSCGPGDLPLRSCSIKRTNRSSDLSRTIWSCFCSNERRRDLRRW